MFVRQIDTAAESRDMIDGTGLQRQTAPERGQSQFLRHGVEARLIQPGQRGQTGQHDVPGKSGSGAYRNDARRRIAGVVVAVMGVVAVMCHESVLVRSVNPVP